MIYTFIAIPPTTTVLKVHISKMEKLVFFTFYAILFMQNLPDIKKPAVDASWFDRYMYD